MKKQVDIRKVTVYAITINSMQIALVLTIAFYLFFSDEQILHLSTIRFGMLGAAFLVSWGALMDIREALGTGRTLYQMESMEKTVQDMEGLNNTLRAQRHDFLNHLQVVFSLMEMEEYKDAQEYIERVYGDIRAVSRVLRTQNAAVNALLKVKLAACEKQGVQADLTITSAWKQLPIPGWEMCRVLSNLIDNALDALKETKNPRLMIALSEDIKNFRFSVGNNGPDIPASAQSRIFLPGITTKSEGHGMGLYIVRQTLREWGGDITLKSGGGETAFSGFVPKELPAKDSQQGNDNEQNMKENDKND